MGDAEFSSWKQLTVPELEALFGFMILMGIVRLPALTDYWKKDDVYHYSPVASRISRERFQDLQKYLHFTNDELLAPTGSPGSNKLGKVQYVMDAIVHQFQSTFNCNREVSVDEAMIPFKGRSSLKQYLPKKPVKRGFKVWVLADSKTGYVNNLEVYKGKDGNKCESGLGSKVVKKLCSNIENRYHHVYFDNFFASVCLLIDLLKVGTYACGTLRSNRVGFPQCLKPFVKKGLPSRGDHRSCQMKKAEGVSAPSSASSIAVSLWLDNKAVVVVSSNCDPSATTQVSRRQRDGSAMSVDCPLSVSLYNKFMGGVDLNDQLRGYYNVRLKGRKFYKYLFWFNFDVAVTNSYVLCKHHSNITVKSVKDFRCSLAKSLIGDFNGRKRPGRRLNSSQPTKKFSEDHFPVKKNKKGRCNYCYHKYHERHETHWFCTSCEKHLCHPGTSNDCFLLYHKAL